MVNRNLARLIRGINSESKSNLVTADCKVRIIRYHQYNINIIIGDTDYFISREI